MPLTYVKDRESVPDDAVVLSKKEALKHQLNFIKQWEKPSEVFFLKYGGIIAGLATFVSSFPIITHFRKQFRLEKFGLYFTYFPGSVLPAALPLVSYDKYVTSNIVLMNMQCPLCMQFKYAAYHICSSIFYTTALTALACTSVAIARRTRYIPSPQTDGKLYLKLYWDVVKAGAQRYKIVTAFQLIVLLFLPYIQAEEFNSILKVAQEKERIKMHSQDSFSSDNFLE